MTLNVSVFLFHCSRKFIRRSHTLLMLFLPIFMEPNLCYPKSPASIVKRLTKICWHVDTFVLHVSTTDFSLILSNISGFSLYILDLERIFLYSNQSSDFAVKLSSSKVFKFSTCLILLYSINNSSTRL